MVITKKFKKQCLKMKSVLSIDEIDTITDQLDSVDEALPADDQELRDAFAIVQEYMSDVNDAIHGGHV